MTAGQGLRKLDERGSRRNHRVSGCVGWLMLCVTCQRIVYSLPDTGRLPASPLGQLQPVNDPAKHSLFPFMGVFTPRIGRALRAPMRRSPRAAFGQRDHGTFPKTSIGADAP